MKLEIGNEVIVFSMGKNLGKTKIAAITESTVVLAGDLPCCENVLKNQFDPQTKFIQTIPPYDYYKA